MPVSKQQRGYANKWDKENMITLGCKVKKEDGEAFKAYAAEQGKSANTILKDFVFECIEKDAATKNN